MEIRATGNNKDIAQMQKGLFSSLQKILKQEDIAKDSVKTFNSKIMSRIRKINAGLLGSEKRLTKAQIRLDALNSLAEYIKNRGENTEGFFDAVLNINEKYKFEDIPVVGALDMLKKVYNNEGQEGLEKKIAKMYEEATKAFEKIKMETQRLEIGFENAITVAFGTSAIAGKNISDIKQIENLGRVENALNAKRVGKLL